MPRVLTLLAIAGLAAHAQAVDGRTKAQLLRRPYTSVAKETTEKEREYFVYLPQGYDTEKGRLWPVILFLHGGGERGDGKADLDKLLLHGPIMEAWTKGRDLPFIIISPQLYTMPPPPSRPNAGGPRPGPKPISRASSDVKPTWAQEGPPLGWWTVEKDLLGMVDSTLKEFRTDPDRVYLTGLSYGGFGTWFMAGSNPGRWAAVAPVCGAADPTVIPAIANAKLPIWIFQGGKDPVVRPEWTTESAAALEKAGHPAVRYSVHEDLAHNVWTRVYEGWDLYYWLLSHRRKP